MGYGKREIVRLSRHVKYSFIEGVYTYKCPKGLWSVSSRDDEYALREALHYFLLSEGDGEYD